jgi:transcription elongation factor GreB
VSKAFVKEPDDEADLPYEPPVIPAGIKNYMTPQSHRHMQDELHQLLRVERPKVVETVAWAAGNGDRSENGDYIYGKRRLREIDRRIRFLSTRLESAEVVDPKQQKKLDQVFFGAPVTYADGRGNVKTIRIVGIDEADLSRGQVSWVSPVARALMKAREGDTVDAFGEIAEKRRAGPLRRCRPLQEQLGESRRARKQHRQGPDTRLDAAYRRFVGKGKSAALDQSRQGSA